MNGTFVIIYVFVVFSVFVFIWFKHSWLIHVSLNNHMKTYHNNTWQKMKDDTGWYRPTWATLYFSKAVYDFIWRSEESFGDTSIPVLRKRIKKVIWELPLFFIATTLLTIMLIMILE